jgi:hypothetical protein
MPEVVSLSKAPPTAAPSSVLGPESWHNDDYDLAMVIKFAKFLLG